MSCQASMIIAVCKLSLCVRLNYQVYYINYHAELKVTLAVYSSVLIDKNLFEIQKLYPVYQCGDPTQSCTFFRSIITKEDYRQLL